MQKIPRALRRIALGAAVLGLPAAAITEYNRPTPATPADRAALMHTALEKPPSRAEQLQKLRQSGQPSSTTGSARDEFDILVIGGGATGAACALDASLRDLRVALVERDDFGSGTSSRSTKLIHGGVRYLEKAFFNLDPAQLRLVFEALRERAVMMHQAPHLAQPIPTLLPCYNTWEVPFYWLGLKAYDLLAALGHGLLHISKFVPPAEALQLFPTLSHASDGRKLRGAIAYYDGQMDDARFNLGVALTAALYGAAITNHTEVVALIHEDDKNGTQSTDGGISASTSTSTPTSKVATAEEHSTTSDKDLSAERTATSKGRVVGARVRDTLTGDEFDVRAKVVINATGPFTDSVRRMDDAEAPTCIVPSAGVHITLPSFYSADGVGLIVPKTKDGRVVFMLPWLGRTIAGTTDSNTTITPLPRPDGEEVAFILDALADYLHIDVRASDVQSAWSGIRPLAIDFEATAKAKAARDKLKAKAKAKAAKKKKKQATDADGAEQTEGKNEAVKQKDNNAGDDDSDDDDGQTQNMVREHMVEVSQNGMVTITGGKWTTQRAMGEDAVDAAIQAAGLDGRASRCKTRFVRLIGAHTWEPSYFTFLAQRYTTRSSKSTNSTSRGGWVTAGQEGGRISDGNGHGRGEEEQQLEVEVAKHLARAYGDVAYKVAELAEAGLGARLTRGYPILEAEVVYCAREEYCETAVDFLARRCRLLFLDTTAATKALPRVVQLMGDALGWDAKRRERETKDAEAVIVTFSCPIPGA